MGDEALYKTIKAGLDKLKEASKGGKIEVKPPIHDPVSPEHASILDLLSNMGPFSIVSHNGGIALYNPFVEGDAILIPCRDLYVVKEWLMYYRLTGCIE